MKLHQQHIYLHTPWMHVNQNIFSLYNYNMAPYAAVPIYDSTETCANTHKHTVHTDKRHYIYTSVHTNHNQTGTRAVIRGLVRKQTP